MQWDNLDFNFGKQTNFKDIVFIRRHKIVRHAQGGQSTDTCKIENSDCHTRNLKFCDTCREYPEF